MKHGVRALLLSALFIVAARFVFLDWQADARQLTQVTDYPAYFWDSSMPEALYVYHTGSRRIDSLELPCAPAHGVTVSADGRLLYLAADSGVTVVTAMELEIVAELAYPANGPVAVSPDNRLVAVMGDSLVVLRTFDYKPVLTEMTAAREGVFADDSRALHCLGAEPSRSVLIVRFSGDSTVSERITFDDGIPTRVIPDPDGTRLFVQLKIQDLLDRVAVVDLLSGEEMYSEFIFPGDGDLASTPGWNRIVYTNSGRMGGPEGSSSFKIFDLESNQPLREVNTRRFVNDSTPHAFPVGPVVVTPDHHWLVALDAPEGRQLLLYDLQSEKFADWVPLGEDRTITSLSVQLRP